LPKDWL